MRHANFMVVEKTLERILLQDVGPWNQHPTITNDAEWVVEQLAPALDGRNLLYYDSEGELTQLVVRDGKFAGFRCFK